MGKGDDGGGGQEAGWRGSGKDGLSGIRHEGTRKVWEGFFLKNTRPGLGRLEAGDGGVRLKVRRPCIVQRRHLSFISN